MLLSKNNFVPKKLFHVKQFIYNVPTQSVKALNGIEFDLSSILTRQMFRIP